VFEGKEIQVLIYNLDLSSATSTDIRFFSVTDHTISKETDGFPHLTVYVDAKKMDLLQFFLVRLF